jgi:hypothetical protein
MPKKLDRCVRKVRRKGYTKSQAYAICSKSTGWARGKGGKWVKKKKRRGKK